MTHTIEPWKRTAYLLGELEPEETQSIRAAIEADPALQTQMKELQQVIVRVQSALQKTPSEHTLTSEQTSAIHLEIQNATPAEFVTVQTAILHTNEVVSMENATSIFSRSWFFGLMAMAAILLLAFSLIPMGLKDILSKSDHPELAQRTNSTEGMAIEYDADAASESKKDSFWVDSTMPLTLSSTFLSGGVVNSEIGQSSIAATSFGETSGTGLNITGTNTSGGTITLNGVNTYSGFTSNSAGTLILSDSRDLGRGRGTVIASNSNQAAASPIATGGPMPGINPTLDPEFRNGSFSGSAPSFSAPSGKTLDSYAVVSNPEEARTKESLANVGGVDQPTANGPVEGKKFFGPGPDRLFKNPVVGSGKLTVTPRIIIPEEEEVKVVAGINAPETSGGRTLKSDGLAAVNQQQTSYESVLGVTSLLSGVKAVNSLELDGRFLSELSAQPSPSGDRYEPIVETPFITTEQAPLSTFSIDVDTASYSKIRQYLMQANQLPQPNAVRIEEMINYFEYDYAGPTDEHPFASNMAVAPCPWNEDHKLVRIGLQAKKMDIKERVKANIVFLLDVSGSMDEPNKLPLVKQAMTMLIRQLGENDRIAMVVYAGAAGCVLPSITGDKQAQILAALDDLNAGGSTNGGQGIELAYSIARDHFIPGGINRVILCTDGDFNVGTTSNEALIKLVQEQAKSNVFLTCLGFGIGNYNDSMMEQISNQGNGIYGMVDTALEARRLMIEQLSGTLVTVAKDVKIQVEMNPSKIASYRLIGYENRRLANEDFNNDKKDAGEIGAGHRVTALYEIVPVGVAPKNSPVDDLRYSSKGKSELQPSKATTEKTNLGNLTSSNFEFAKEWLTLKLRYKQPEADVSSKREFFLTDEAVLNSAIDNDFQWSGAVAEFGLLLRRSQLAPQANWDQMLHRARSATGENAYRIECLEMMTKAKSLSGK